MGTTYRPPFSITPKIVQLVAEIGEQLGRQWSANDKANVRLRRIHRIRTIQGSLAIEGNTLSEAQITAILDGKRVIAPLREVQEARNAIKAYDNFSDWRPARRQDLLTAHRLLMMGLADDAGRYRSGNVGVMKGKRVLHMAPPASRVPILMRNLLAWLSKTDHHPLVASSIFHYEFEFIHPFSDGNGRLGRLWQTVILGRWNVNLAGLPIESMVHRHQRAYYRAIALSTKKSDAAPFVEFMLTMIRDTIVRSTPQVAPQVTPQVKRLLGVLRGTMNRDDLQAALGLKDRKSFRERYLKPALDAGLIEMTVPSKPNSRLQRYKAANQLVKRSK